jgi:hypothetical protein
MASDLQSSPTRPVQQNHAASNAFGDLISPKSPTGKHSHSEDDWAWVCAQLTHGLDAAKLTHELVIRRSDKPDPLYYAQRTVDVA